MKIQQVIETQMSSVLAYRDGLTQLLYAYVLLNRPEDYMIKVNFISEIILWKAYLTAFHEIDKKMITGVSNSYMRSVEQFLGTDKSTRTFLAIF